MTIDTLFATLETAPAVQALRQRVEQGGFLPNARINVGAHPFVAVLLHHLFPQRPVVVVTAGLRTQEGVQQDVETWLQVEALAREAGQRDRSLFYPPWEILPQEAKLPHVDVISERLETLLA